MMSAYTSLFSAFCVCGPFHNSMSTAVVLDFLCWSFCVQDGQLKQGDQLLEINSTPVTGLQPSEVANILRAAGDTAHLVIARPKPVVEHKLDQNGGPIPLPTVEKTAEVESQPMDVSLALSFLEPVVRELIFPKLLSCYNRQRNWWFVALSSWSVSEVFACLPLTQSVVS